MKKFFAVSILSILSFGLFAAGDDNWFMAQTKKAPISSITATSELIEAQYEGKYIYPPVNIIDGNLDNTWCESVQDGPGIGESITIEFTKPVSFDEIQIVNGFAYKDYYKKNNRVKDIQITQVAKKHFQQKTYTLEDNKPEWQSIKFEYTQTAQTITLKIVSVYKGEKYDDTCLDDIRLLYKGKVIPFENVDQIKKTQEENSKLMLQSDAGSFKEQFTSLFGPYRDSKQKVLILMADNKKDIMAITMSKDGDLQTIDNGKYFKSSTSFKKIEDEIKKDYYYTISKEDQQKITDNNSKKDIIVIKYPWSWYRKEEVTLGNFRIIVDTTVDYVTTTTSMLIKLDGTKSVYINGKHYTVCPPEDYVVISAYEEP